jgi:NADPH-dependent 2,4-dienoyl-CoA reductase/sulfur reductase-like enzyme
VAERLAAEVVVVGAGPAGIAAAVHAAEGGARVLLLDEAPRPGGQIWRHASEPPAGARPWLERLERTAAGRVTGASVVDVVAQGTLLAEREGQALRVAFQRLVLATGARECFLPFAGWTLPGVLGVGGAQALLKSGGRFAGQRAVVAGSGPLLVAVAAALADAGARIAGVAEQAPFGRLVRFGSGLWRHPRKLAEGAAYRLRFLRAPYRAGSWVRAAEGRERVERAIVTDGRREWTWECDLLACAFGLAPNLELPRLLGCATSGEHAVRVGEDQSTSVPGVFAAGELCGVGGVDQALATGAIAGLAAAGRPVPAALRAARRREQAFAASLASAFDPRPELRRLAAPETVVCRCEDVPLARVQTARSAREAKLVTRAGMGPCQSRVCGPALAFLFGWEPDRVRPPLKPVALSTLEDEA